MEALYRPPQSRPWQGRPSQDASYLHENIALLDLAAPGEEHPHHREPALLGYACDAGVARNLGRPGSTEGPAALRKALAKMPWPETGPGQLWDAGDVLCPSDKLETAQALLALQVERLLERGYFPLCVGGGHDIAFGHYSGVRRHLKQGQLLGIINFDAHFDLRRPEPAPHSGSPFYQIARACRNEGTEFRYACLGVRRDANPRELWERANAWDVLSVERHELARSSDSVLERLHAFMQPLDAIYLTIDLDGFASAFAPGVSAASPMGFYPEEIMPILEAVLQSGKLVSADIAELNPAFDRDGQTAVLGAALLHKILSFPGLF
jgi:formiminoglutamase